MKTAESRRDLRSKTVDDLKTEILSLQKAHFNMRLQKATQQLNDTSQLRVIRRSVARAKTILAQLQPVSPQK